MLRISQLEPTDQAVVLRVEGQIMGPWVNVLQTCCEEALTEGQSVTLDLADVTFMDTDGIALLRELTAQRVALVNCSPFAATQLRS
jgi:anti-anti-sigma regulatory factor